MSLLNTEWLLEAHLQIPDMSHFKGIIQGLFGDPHEKATRLYTRSFDTPSHLHWNMAIRVQPRGRPKYQWS